MKEKPSRKTFSLSEAIDLAQWPIVKSEDVGKLFTKEKEEKNKMNEDNWKHRSSKMRCKTCMWFMLKEGARPIGRCRRHAPTMSGWPVMFEEDWCGDHKLNENIEEK